MTVDFHFDVERRYTIVTVHGVLTVEVAREALTQLYAQDVRPLVILWDLSAATLDAETSDVVELVGFIRKNRGEGGANKVAIVTSREVDFGVSRMYEARGDTLPFEIQVFRESTAAKSWLGVET